MNAAGVCYVATDGYLFQTAVSAMQARAHVDESVRVVVVRIADADSAEGDAIGEVCRANGVEFVSRPRAAIDDLHPTYARFFLDRLVPEGIDELLYVDGDTQIVGDLMPLLRAVPAPGGMLAVRDPMVFLREGSPRWRRRIDGWWRGSSMPEPVQRRYVNAGVLRIRRADVPPLRTEALALRAVETDLRFADQDLLNRVGAERIETVDFGWNFPGFLLGTPLQTRCTPRILHFMSNPRPWEAPFAPWGDDHHAPYRDAVRTWPALEPFWQRSGAATRVRYSLQQAVKARTERPVWDRPEVVATFDRYAESDRPTA